MGLKYEITLKRRGNLFWLFIPELAIVVEHDNLNSAYLKLEEEKKRYFEKMISIGSEEEIEEPVSKILKKGLFNDLFLFAVKGVIIVFFSTIFFWASLATLGSFVGQQINNKLEMLPSEIVNILPERLEKKLDSITIKEKERTILILRTRLQKIKPFVDEFRLLLKDESDCPPTVKK